MGNERRDFGRRADCQRRTITRLLAVDDGLSAADLADNYLSFEGVQRILRRFAWKHLVRRDGNRWVGTRLLEGCAIVQTKGFP